MNPRTSRAKVRPVFRSDGNFMVFVMPIFRHCEVDSRPPLLTSIMRVLGHDSTQGLTDTTRFREVDESALSDEVADSEGNGSNACSDDDSDPVSALDIRNPGIERVDRRLTRGSNENMKAAVPPSSTGDTVHGKTGDMFYDVFQALYDVVCTFYTFRLARILCCKKLTR
jgi:hypothetical protein